MSLKFDCRHRFSAGFQLAARFEMNRKVTALCGPSGSGKTTILRLIAGLLRPDEGRIQVGEQAVTDTAARLFVAPERRRIGLLFQDHCLFPHLRVKANILYGVRRQTTPGIPLERIARTLEIADLLDRDPRSLSGGQQQRVALARALAPAPRLLLLDEPLTAVEAPLRERIVELLERVVAEFDIPLLLVTHNRGLVDRLAEQVVEIQEGRVVE